ncbi:MAG: fluoride efflux transporter CrcB [Acidobacteriota bacterium]
MVKNLLWIGLGGFCGAIARWACAGWIQRLSDSAFPWGTAVVNGVGCLVIGMVAGWAEGRQVLSPESRAFLVVGVLGSFTTFSTFGLETWELARGGGISAAAGNVGLQVTVGLAAVIAGAQIGRWLA